MTDERVNISTVFDMLQSTFWKKGRQETFKYWPFKSDEHHCNPDNMAAAGFYAIGGENEPDLAECFMCNKQLDGWEPDDDPWEEHKKHQPNCLFIEINKPDELSLTVKELFQLIQHQLKHNRTLKFDKTLEDMKKKWKEIVRTIPTVYEAMKKNHKSLD